MQISYELVRELFKYKNGVLVWKKSPSWGVKKGAAAGYLRLDGYRRVWVRGYRYYVHQLVWMYHNGYFPDL